ncbi:hypothetical protein [Paraburkholderia diazotrophica]|uniref:Uncharacterized protein n=1 Tax=Paraburkholderia diazotrophica TaxID=667676 RepID=A0A1H7E1F6_9BURK|nr:hypothetical protein [Paraburkholderia diazotrophica]SEK05380.1 hypothetical protein SAMN05192539_10356 [Paraburkholderia diazotrophica]
MTLFDYLPANRPQLLQLTLQHAWLVSLAVGCAIIAGVPIGVADLLLQLLQRVLTPKGVQQT